MQNLVFPVTLAMNRVAMRAEGAEVSLLPGTRRMPSYLFSPFLQVAGTALRER